MKLPEVMAPAQPAAKESVFITIPGKDVLGRAMPMYRINTMEFEPGQTHAVSQEIATELERMVANYQKSRLRLIQATPDLQAVNTAIINGPAPRSMTPVLTQD